MQFPVNAVSRDLAETRAGIAGGRSTRWRIWGFWLRTNGSAETARFLAGTSGERTPASRLCRFRPSRTCSSSIICCHIRTCSSP